jgi:hypothetical protein
MRRVPDPDMPRRKCSPNTPAAPFRRTLRRDHSYKAEALLKQLKTAEFLAETTFRVVQFAGWPCGNKPQLPYGLAVAEAAFSAQRPYQLVGL